VTRAIGISHFELHNDEAIYIEASQIIGANWEDNKYWTLDGRMRSDYKYPIPYWFGSWVLQHSDAIPYNVRVLSCAFGLLGFASLFLLAASLWNLRAAFFTCILILFSEYFLYFDSIFLAEAFVYGLGGLFWLLVHENARRPRVWMTLLAGAVGCLLLTTKASAKLFAVWSIPLLFLGWRSSEGADGERSSGDRTRVRSCLLHGSVYGLSVLGHNAIMPFNLDRVEKHLVQTNVIRSADELMAFPWQGWLDNLEFYQAIWMTEWHLGGMGMLLLVLAVGRLLWGGERASFEKYVVLGLMAVSVLVPAVLLSKVQYARHFGMGFYALYLFLGISLAVASERVPDRWRGMRNVLLCVGLAGLVVWKMCASYEPLIRWRQTPLAIQETPWDWAKGIGIFELIDFLTTLPPGTLVIHGAWGHPSTAVEVFKGQYPQLKLLRRAVINVSSLSAHAREISPEPLYFVYDPRDKLQANRPFLRFCVPRKIIDKKFQDQTFMKSHIVVCEIRTDYQG
jgi:hypothetical protein